ncbi:hypothetical protein GUJ93_ZPchr0010g8963 [Zizania palustris]|uniref:DUF659 domain-containing protein n=1 Tax=Zizania palustris TaxID=103762 RepID=A0A8J5WDI4_ZIZPA|nr:hypothetical protein GUJ93_ZPchr0010g8963 [Zizania palustris]
MSEQEASSESSVHPSYESSNKRRKQSSLSESAPESEKTKLIDCWDLTPDFIVYERQCTRSEEERQKVHRYVANFFYECGVPLEAIKSLSFEVMAEAIGQFGHGYEPPSIDQMRGPLLNNAVKEIHKLRERHEQDWRRGRCTLMLDSWTDQRKRMHLVNFLINSTQGTFFLESVDVTEQSLDAVMLADLIEKRIEVVGRDKVVQIVTKNDANFKAASRLLMERIPTLFWTPCAAQCLDLMLEDIGKLKEFKKHIKLAKHVTTFVYRHGRLLLAMKDKIGGKDLVRPTATRSSTTFLTLKRLYKYKDALRCLFVNDDWSRSKLSSTETGKKVHDIVLSTTFWSVVKDCISASQPVLFLLRTVISDERPAMPELYVGMDLAKKKLNDSFASKPGILNKVMDIIKQRWAEQSEQRLYEAAMYLNPGIYFDIKRDDHAYASKLRMIFDGVLRKMVVDDDLLANISVLANQYENRENFFGRKSAIEQVKILSPYYWWHFYGNHAYQLQALAIRIVGLCCSSSGYQCDYRAFESIHRKKGNYLEYKRWNNLAYIRYNRMFERRFEKQNRESIKCNPLILEDFQWDNEWVDMGAEEAHTWIQIHGDEDTSSPHLSRGTDLSRRTDVEAIGHRGCRSSKSRFIDESTCDNEEDEPLVVDDEAIEDDYGPDPPSPTDESAEPSGKKDETVDSWLYDDF